MKTRDRILECALTLFNQQGEPNVSTLEIANEMGISPGNLYYHFHGKEPLILSLFERFQAELAPLLDPPSDARLEAEDYWMFLHLIVERLSHYRFLFQDLSNLAGRLPKLARGIRNLLNSIKKTLASLLARFKSRGQLVSETQALGQLVEQITMNLLFSLDYQRILGREGDVRVVVYQIMMLVTPHLLPTSRQAAEQLVMEYLGR
ncbi:MULTISPECIES: TetR/AcrR family transcriptional regulator [Pseudomonas syringae group genomosp. 2]|uniref:TetR/AcrR family transcriptional regulator n=1 Tax=Pseudomonas syringae group genomosp. 2 TaxID=251698 RepID=UPI0001CC109C|nr:MULTISPECIES: TetR/AcrR family transcriptional regulator [Pseudomonas syringae group genomosp. 2]EGH00409.1 transcriptional regulator PhaD [Pseudomonas amygdali pv. aesculi str. 0893_23]KWT07060.1 TetR family transcriptional regulator [Pseudomonas amygdali pv. aesculi]KWT18851.1 TetR family transcriptional regulator [Pseudomonas amygdali pv. aesculi]KWT19979.1 TetR family transcriptional regulator [Pseudomonas amygdali pv. aesculi]KWT20690.1 TetR family transcriptional regulator [Pseudomona